MKWFGVITIFPAMFDAIKDYGITSQGIERGFFQLETFFLRDYTFNRHKTVDDRPFGGGPGMLLKPEPLALAVQDAKQRAQAAGFVPEQIKVILLSPQGTVFKHAHSVAMAQDDQAYIFVCGRYEGVDQRFIDKYVDQEWSLGDFVLTGGELGAMMMIDAIIRHLPGLLNHDLSAVEDSFANGLLDCPHYTRPEVFEGVGVPEVLMSGHHEKIALWRLEQAMERTYRLRPELITQLETTTKLTKSQARILAKLRGEPNPYPTRSEQRKLNAERRNQQAKK